MRRDRYGYAPGRCTICSRDRDVRWKNLYTIGSEGTDMCQECEKQVLDFIRSMMMDHTVRRKKEFIARREEKRRNAQHGGNSWLK